MPYRFTTSKYDITIFLDSNCFQVRPVYFRLVYLRSHASGQVGKCFEGICLANTGVWASHELGDFERVFGNSLFLREEKKRKTGKVSRAMSSVYFWEYLVQVYVCLSALHQLMGLAWGAAGARCSLEQGLQTPRV